MSTGYAITVIEYAARPEFPEHILLFGGGGGTRDVPFAFGVLEGDDGLYLVDTGIGATDYQNLICDRQGISRRVLAQDRLAEAGLDAADVKAVFITHAHYDHFGNVEAFPNAVFYVQRREVQEWLWMLSQPASVQYFSDSIDPHTLQTCVTLAAEGRLRLVEGDVIDVLPGVDLRAADDTHTFGSMWLSVRGRDGRRYALVGDNMYSYESVEAVADGGVIVPIGASTGSNVRQIQCIKAILDEVEGDVTRIIPFHDAALRTLYPHSMGQNDHAAIAVSR